MTLIMVVDDDAEIVSTLEKILKDEGYDVLSTTDPRSARSLIEAQQPDLIVLDVLMPGLDGISLCLAVREMSRVPILFLSGKSEPGDRAIGLRVGADDYISKPFDTDELLARIAAHLRRSHSVSKQPLPSSQRITFPGIVIDDYTHTVMIAGTLIDATATEYRILRVFLRHPNEVLSRDALVAELAREGADLETHSIPVHLRRLRHKIELAHGPVESIATVRGFGYRFTPPTDGRAVRAPWSVAGNAR